MKTKILIEVEIEHFAGTADDMMDLVDNVLDRGTFQDALNDRAEETFDVRGTIRVASVVSRWP